LASCKKCSFEVNSRLYALCKWPVLGTLPLAFSTSDIFTTVFIAFLALVLLGVSHGLILLPVLLSLMGPEECISLAATVPAVTKKETGDVAATKVKTTLPKVYSAEDFLEVTA
jgi:hypothetical protein